MITGLQQCHYNAESGRHTGGCGHRLLALFHRRQSLLKGAHCGVGVAADVAIDLLLLN